jgi:hypothetical protein
MRPLLQILIPTLPERSASFGRLKSELERQILETGNTGMVEILSDDSPRNEKTIGEKRNALVAQSNSDYVCFVDDDDDVSRNYVSLIVNTITETNYPDCISLKGVITWDGDNPQLFEHSIKYKAYDTVSETSLGWFRYVSDSTAPVNYLRFPNHLNAIKSEIVKQFKFPHINFSEDTSFAHMVHQSGLIKTEGYINEVIYHYDFKPSK